MYIAHGFWHNMFGIELFSIRGLSDDVMAAEVEVLAVYLLEQKDEDLAEVFTAEAGGTLASEAELAKTFIVTEDIAKPILLLEVTINKSCVVKTKMNENSSCHYTLLT